MLIGPTERGMPWTCRFGCKGCQPRAEVCQLRSGYPECLLHHHAGHRPSQTCPCTTAPTSRRKLCTPSLVPSKWAANFLRKHLHMGRLPSKVWHFTHLSMLLMRPWLADAYPPPDPSMGRRFSCQPGPTMRVHGPPKTSSQRLWGGGGMRMLRGVAICSRILCPNGAAQCAHPRPRASGHAMSPPPSLGSVQKRCPLGPEEVEPMPLLGMPG